MRPTMCTRCQKNVAVVFITKIEGGDTKNEGLCLKCARELGIKPVDDMMKKMGISDEDLESISTEMMSAFGGAEEPEGMAPAGEDGDGPGTTRRRTRAAPPPSPSSASCSAARRTARPTGTPFSGAGPPRRTRPPPRTTGTKAPSGNSWRTTASPSPGRPRRAGWTGSWAAPTRSSGPSRS